MPKDIKSSVSRLVMELRKEISALEKELVDKRDVLSALEKVAGIKKGRGPGRKPKSAIKRGRRKSKNRDVVLDAAKTFKGQFSLQELLNKIKSKNSKFGGKYPASTVITVLRTTPEVKKLKRGTYKYAG
ncbi:MAG TPA: hypothetical protein VGB30_03500 [bacterium]|jgi:hypothetical protein